MSDWFREYIKFQLAKWLRLGLHATGWGRRKLVNRLQANLGLTCTIQYPTKLTILIALLTVTLGSIRQHHIIISISTRTVPVQLLVESLKAHTGAYVMVTAVFKVNLLTTWLPQDLVATVWQQYQSVRRLQGPWACRIQQQNMMRNPKTVCTGGKTTPLTAITGSIELIILKFWSSTQQEPTQALAFHMISASVKI